MLRVIRNHRRAAYGQTDGYEQLAVLPVALDHATLAAKLGENGAELSARAKAAWDRALEGGEKHGTATPRRPSSRRPARSASSWIATRRHRARLRAREVQEARRRRVLQDHQPRGAGSASRAGLSRLRDRRDRGVCGGPREPCAAPGVNNNTLRARGFTDEKIETLEKSLAAPSTSSSSSTSGTSARTSSSRR